MPSSLPLLLPFLAVAATWWGLASFGPASLWAQSQLTEKVARVEVPVYEDNLDDAKSRAIAQGQLLALRSLIGELVAEEWVALFDKELRQGILRQKERYISSYRVQKLEASLDRTRFLAVISARINRPELVEDLRELSLPLREDPPATVEVFYARNDPVLRDANLRADIAERLTARLALLNYRVTRTTPVPAETALVLGNPMGAFNERLGFLAKIGSATALFLAFETPPPVPGDPPGGKSQALLYQKGSGTLIATLERVDRELPFRLPGRSKAERTALLARLVDPLIVQIQPGAIASVRGGGEGGDRLTLRVFGFSSVEEQEGFEHAFFRRNSPFERFSLATLAPDRVTYEGPYAGERVSLEEELRGKAVGEFRIREVYWYNDTLEIDVKREQRPVQTEMKRFPPEQRPPEVAAALGEFFGRYSQLEVEDPLFTEVEDNGWLDRANPLPFQATIYGFVDSRSDSDVYVGEALASDETVTVIWLRVSRTHLTPALRFYDEDGVLVATFYPRSWLRYEYKLPKGQHRFYLEVADRFGFLKVDTGGYRNYHYLFKVERKGS